MSLRSTSDPQDDTALDSRQEGGPTAARMLVGAELRRLRRLAGISREAACEAIRASDSKISRLELGRTGFKQRDVADLLSLYGVTDEAERQALLELARQASAPGWWHRYDDAVPAWYEPYIGLEQAASVIRVYEVQFIPDLLQTPDYTRAFVRLREPEASGERIERRVDLWRGRQEIFHRPRPPHLWVVIDETALRRPVGGRAVMRAQIRQLIETAALPHVTVQVLPFSIGGHAATTGPITYLRFSEAELLDVVFLLQLSSAVYLDKSAHTECYRDVLDRLVIQAEQATETAPLLRRILDEL
ncbi:MAG TPA: helix-turn-helix transcriptional regulator [Streptosporangiaceae bacterium]|nr:helix-turn-helix transcriptional regulator [Streptosporangiaceae bacterium]